MTSKYYGVSFTSTTNGDAAKKRNRSEKPWLAFLQITSGACVRKQFKTEMEAAKAVDMALIQNGLPPRNVLKPK